MRILKTFSLYFLIAVALSCFAIWLNSKFLFEYLRGNIIGLLITLLAINTATTGLTASKMQDMLTKYPKINFQKTISEMKFSLFEQIVLIALSVFSLIFLDSEVVFFEYKELLFDSILVAILIYAIDILWDTGQSVFVAIELIQEQGEKPEQP